MRKYQACFKVQIDGVGRTGNGYRPRKPHQKSRSGCGNCKARRVKCDENKENGCIMCQGRGLVCDYLHLSSSTTDEQVMELESLPTAGNEDRDMHCPKPERGLKHGLTEETSTISTFGKKGRHNLGYAWNGASFPYRNNVASALLLSVTDLRLSTTCAALHHFETITSYTCSSPLGHSIIQSHMLRLAFQVPFLMHALLGVTAAHLSYLLPMESNSPHKARNQIVGAWHWSQGLPLFRRELGADFRQAGKEKTDALLSTLMLLAMYQFMIWEEHEEPAANMKQSDIWRCSFVFLEEGPKREAALSWLSIHRGLSLILRRFDGHLADSAWLPLLEDISWFDRLELLQWSEITSVGGEDQVEKSFFEICGTATNMTDKTNPYYESLKTVLFLRRVRPIQPHLFAKMITFMGRITADFMALIRERDIAALLILCHWLSLMQKMQHWWVLPRADRECRAIIMFILQRDVEQLGNDIAWRLLKEPAEVVGVAI